MIIIETIIDVCPKNVNPIGIVTFIIKVSNLYTEFDFFITLYNGGLYIMKYIIFV